MTSCALILTLSGGLRGGIERYVEALEWSFAEQQVNWRRIDLCGAGPLRMSGCLPKRVTTFGRRPRRRAWFSRIGLCCQWRYCSLETPRCPVSQSYATEATYGDTYPASVVREELPPVPTSRLGGGGEQLHGWRDLDAVAQQPFFTQAYLGDGRTRLSMRPGSPESDRAGRQSAERLSALRTGGARADPTAGGRRVPEPPRPRSHSMRSGKPAAGLQRYEEGLPGMLVELRTVVVLALAVKLIEVAKREASRPSGMLARSHPDLLITRSYLPGSGGRW